jgi:hypothetical protein
MVEKRLGETVVELSFVDGAEVLIVSWAGSFELCCDKSSFWVLFSVATMTTLSRISFQDNGLLAQQ